MKREHKPYAIFDMDGTLVDSMGYWQGLGREYLRSKGITENIQEIDDEIAPLTMSEAAALFVERFHLGGTAENIMDEMNHIMEEHYMSDIQLKKGVRELLEELRLSGVRMCVASTTNGKLVHDCLKHLGVLSYFEFTLSCEDFHTNKCEPLIFLEAAGRLDASPAETAVYEDALFAMETAKKAGFSVIAVRDGVEEPNWNKICNLADEIADI